MKPTKCTKCGKEYTLNQKMLIFSVKSKGEVIIKCELCNNIDSWKYI